MSGVYLNATLAQTVRNTQDIYFWLAALAIAVALIVIAALVVRKRLGGGDDEAARGLFTLADLRQMHREGQITDSEFERAKAAIIAHSKAMLDDEDHAAGD